MSAGVLGVDLDLVDPKSSQAAIIKACVKTWFKKREGIPYKSDCNGFLKAVQQELCLRPFEGDANGIFSEVDGRSDWETLGVGPRAASKAGSMANHGYFVIAVWKNNEPKGHGHVAIITAYLNFLGSSSEQRAIGAWGQLHAVGSLMDRMTQAFGGDKRPQIKYARCVTRPFNF